MDVQSRIDCVEKNGEALESALALIRHEHFAGEELRCRLRSIEIELVTIKAGIAQLQKSGSDQTEQVRRLYEFVASVRVELMRVATQQSLSATKADSLKAHGMMAAVGQRLEFWMVEAALVMTALIFGVIFWFVFT